MACGISTATQQVIQTQSIYPTETKESDINSGNVRENFTSSVDSLSDQNVEPTGTIEPTPTMTVDPNKAAKMCLTKTWEIDGLGEYILAAVPQELSQEYHLEYVESTGSANLTLQPDEIILLNADNLVLHFSAQYAIFQVPVTVSIDGTGVGTYEVKNSTLIIENMDTSGMTASAKALNEDLMDPEQILRAIPFVQPPLNTAEFTCQGDKLSLKMIGYADEIPQLIFYSVDP
jgi:hypothetical protein